MIAMNISLTQELANIIHSKVESGLYGNASEVVREAIRRLNGNAASEQYEQKLAELKRELEIGVEQVMRGKVKTLSYEAVMKRLDTEQ